MRADVLGDIDLASAFSFDKRAQACKSCLKIARDWEVVLCTQFTVLDEIKHCTKSSHRPFMMIGLEEVQPARLVKECVGLRNKSGMHGLGMS